jgi:hypothetical protein
MDINEAARAMGRVKSPRKAASSAANLVKARQARNKPQEQSQQRNHHQPVLIVVPPRPEKE